MTRLTDRKGLVYGRLTVVDRAPNDDRGRTMWNCLCKCGNAVSVRSSGLASGNTKSCGCLNDEKRRETKIHGMHGTHIYMIYRSMKARCENPNSKAFKYYGACGISVCDRWKDSFSNFYADMGDAPTGLTLERKDNAKGYSPDNCLWADRSTQSANRRRRPSNSGFTGVASNGYGKWVSKIVWRGEYVHIGTFKSKHLAACARDTFIVKNNLPHKLNFRAYQ